MAATSTANRAACWQATIGRNSRCTGASCKCCCIEQCVNAWVRIPSNWGGAIMWRGTTPGVPVRTDASFIGLGGARHRVVFYPISPTDPATGQATINWIAEITVDSTDGWLDGDWNRRVHIDEFIGHFADWNYGWLDVPAMLRGARISV